MATPGEINFNLFQETSKDNIRVGYISTDRGFIQNVSVPDANCYAKKNPGTTFILNNRDGVRYLNINDVNALTIEDIEPKKTANNGNCNPVIGLNEIDRLSGISGSGGFDDYKTRVHFFGGGGIGAKGNPVIGSDGSLLAIDLESGGFGYKYAPYVKVDDDLDIGSGAVTRAILCEVESVTQYFSTEKDFEEYFCPDEDEVGFGQRFTPEGKVLGDWNPRIYANTDKNPFRREIDKYQRFLSQITKPWWNTRKEVPLNVTSPTSKNRVRYNSKHPAWSDFMNRYSISPVPPTNRAGSDFAGIPYTFEWEENFPFDGEYVFRGACDNKGQLYLDNSKVMDLGGFKGNGSKFKKFMKSGVHKIRLDLLNVPIKETVKGTDGSQNIFNTLDSIDKADRRLWKMNPGSRRGSDFLNRFGVLPFDPGKEVIQDVPASNTRLEKPQVKLVSDGRNLKLKVTGTGQVKVNFKLKVNDNLRTSGVFAKEVIIDTDTDQVTLKRDIKTRQAGRGTYLSGKKRETIYGSGVFTAGKTYDIKVIGGSPTSGFKSIDSRSIGFDDDINNGFDQNGLLEILSTKAVRVPTSRAQKTNYPNKTSDSFAGTHLIRWEKVDFPIDGNYIIEVMADDNAKIFIGNRSGGGRKEIGNGLRSVTRGGDETIITKIGFSGPGKSTGKSSYTRYFKKGSYRIRVELQQKPGKGLSDGNPMGVAINISTENVDTVVVSPKSWTVNPMGVALTIDAPLPPIPQEPIPQQEGRCPNNPIWTTRFPGASSRWWPVVDTLGRWGKFQDRYAISPVPPLATKGTDNGGVVYSNRWDIEIPYEGFYGLQGTVDNAGRILIDGKEQLIGGYFSGAKFGGKSLQGFKTENPNTKKIFLSEGRHTIEVQLENYSQEITKTVRGVVFDTAKWATAAKTSISRTNVNFNINSSAKYSNRIRIPDIGLDVGKSYGGSQIRSSVTKEVEAGRVYTVEVFSPESKSGVRLRTRGGVLQTEEAGDNDWSDLTCAASKGRFFDFKQGANKATCKFIVDGDTKLKGGTAGGATRNGVTYSGPRLSTYLKGRLGPFITPAYKNDEDYLANFQGKTWRMKWTNVDFPTRGQYQIQIEGDDVARVFVDGVEVGSAKTFEGVITREFTSDRGKRTVEIELFNQGEQRGPFSTNPTNVACKISTMVKVSDGTQSWKLNPMGISAALIPPPCPKEIRGQGIICRVDIDDPGNGYVAPPGAGYPVALRLRSVDVEDSGINYTCGVDQLQITPSNGAVLDYDCDPFGKIRSVKILDPGFGFTQYPEITMISDTGVNARFRPQFEVIRDPIAEPEKLIQVTDLVGLEQTGYVEGRPYYGAVFYKDGVRFAGYYETPGDLVQVYDTLQESIDGVVTTKPSAIQRQGTNIQSNDPRLNIPGTPENLT